MGQKGAQAYSWMNVVQLRRRSPPNAFRIRKKWTRDACTACPETVDNHLCRSFIMIPFGGSEEVKCYIAHITLPTELLADSKIPGLVRYTCTFQL